MPNADLIERLRPRLEAQLREVLQRQARVSAHLLHLDEAAPADSQERAQSMQNDEVLEALDTHGLEEISAIRDTLRRMDEGTYEICTVCSEPIGAGRLEALLYATTCVACASAQS